MMANELTAEQIEEFSDAFNLFDGDKDRYVTPHELKCILNSLGIVADDDDMIDILDEIEDEDGKISYDEFLKLMASHVNDNSTEDEMKAVFRKFDLNGKGYLTPFDLQCTMKDLGEHLTNKHIAEMIKVADSNGNKLISYDEFAYLYMKITGKEGEVRRNEEDKHQGDDDDVGDDDMESRRYTSGSRNSAAHQSDNDDIPSGSGLQKH